MSTIPTKTQNPTGLHQRYAVKKIKRHPHAGRIKYSETDGVNELITYWPDIELVDPDENEEYFVMRLDEGGGSDMEHIKACRIGVHAYADAIEHHLPDLASDLRERYPLL